MKIETKDQIDALIKKHGSAHAAAIAGGIPDTTFRRAMVRLGSVEATTTTTPKKTPSATTTATRTLDDFRREHDQTWKIRDGLKRLFKGGTYMTDAEFREAVGGNSARWRSAADASEFREYKYRVGGEWLWASKDTIKAMRQIKGEAI
mgnify:CR=1 FL=1